jgi:hypothetical protein
MHIAKANAVGGQQLCGLARVVVCFSTSYAINNIANNAVFMPTNSPIWHFFDIKHQSLKD